MVSFPVSGPIDEAQLRDELDAAGFDVVAGARKGGRLTVEFAGAFDYIAAALVVDAHQPDEHQQLDQLIDKARAVFGGQGSFTQAQAQKILAGLVLLEARRR